MMKSENNFGRRTQLYRQTNTRPLFGNCSSDL